jgi:hypothetical protein
MIVGVNYGTAHLLVLQLLLRRHNARNKQCQNMLMTLHIILLAPEFYI